MSYFFVENVLLCRSLGAERERTADFTDTTDGAVTSGKGLWNQYPKNIKRKFGDIAEKDFKCKEYWIGITEGEA